MNFNCRHRMVDRPSSPASCQSPWLYSLLVVGMTTTSTVAFWSAMASFKTSRAEASPIEAVQDQPSLTIDSAPFANPQTFANSTQFDIATPDATIIELPPQTAPIAIAEQPIEQPIEQPVRNEGMQVNRPPSPIASASPIDPAEATEFGTSAAIKAALNSAPDVRSADAPAATTIAQSTPADRPTADPASSNTSVDSPPTISPETDATGATDATNATDASSALGRPFIHIQGAYVLVGDESSARLRVAATYTPTPHVLLGATADLVSGNAFSETAEPGFSLNELFATVSPTRSNNLRFTVGLLDLTSYFDRNSFAKDVVTQFFNPVFQTNPALAAAGISRSRLGLLVNWSITDHVGIKLAGFSSDRDLDDFALDAFAGELDTRLGNLIVRATYVNSRDAGDDDGFDEIFQFSRNQGRDFGLQSGDREESFGINAEYFIPELNLGLFGRYGHYQNLALDRGGDTYSFGFNLLDLFLADDRLGLGYGRRLSNDELRDNDGDKVPDVLELFYDFRITRNFRAGATLQFRNGFSETYAGFRIRADFDVK